MLFNSLTFLLFVLPISIVIYAIVEKFTKKSIWKNIVLLIFSVIFFAWSGLKNLQVLLLLVIVNYIFGMTKKESKKVLLIGVVFNIGVLIYYKYLNSLIDGFNSIFSSEFEAISIIVPLGISFIIFHCISYLLDLYNDKVEPNHNIIEFALYIMFFPKLIQGPIVKYQDMMPQIKNHSMKFNLFIEGVERFIIGLSKKVLIADVISTTVNNIFSLTSGEMQVATAWLGTILFSIQIYMDFSGYSDMAIGIGKIFGFHWKENFDFPYISKSITEFWRRWHISLGSWFKEYLYIPLGGNRKGNVYINLFIVFLITGIWHGSTLLFILWGMLHGICVVIERWMMKKQWYAKIPNAVKWFLTMFIVNYGWIAFKISNFSDFIIFNKALFGIGNSANDITFSWQYFLTPHIITLIVIFVICQIVFSRKKIQEWLLQKNSNSKLFNVAKYIIILGLAFLCFINIVSSTYSPFIYFQF